MSPAMRNPFATPHPGLSACGSIPPAPARQCDTAARNAVGFIHQSQETLANCHTLSARIAELLVGPEPAMPGEMPPPGVAVMQSLEATQDSLRVLQDRLMRIAEVLGVST